MHGTFTYTPNADFFGSDSFEYTISDGNGGSSTSSVNITVNEVVPPNTAPVSQDDTVSVDENSSVVINASDLLANDSDADGDSLSISSITSVSNGSLVDNADGTFTYTPNADFFGSDSFEYTISDGNGGSSTSSVNITVNEVVNELDLSADPIDNFYAPFSSPINSISYSDTDLTIDIAGTPTVYNNVLSTSITAFDLVSALANEQYSDINTNLVDNTGSNFFDVIRFSDLNIFMGDSGNNTITAGDNASGYGVTGFDDYNFIYGGSGNDVLRGYGFGNGARAELLYDDEFFSITTTRDIIAGGEGNDTIYGGKLRENLWGGNGDDTYIYENANVTVGDDIINDLSGANDRLVFQAYDSSGVTMSQEGNNLRIQLDDIGLGHSVLVEDYFTSDSIETIEFTNESLSVADVTALV